MKRTLCLLVFLTSLCFGQSGYNSYQTGSFSAPGSGVPIKQNTTSLYHQISWVNTGSVLGCTLAIDSSPDGVTYTPGGILSGQTCTSNGNSAIVAGQAVYIRMTFTALSGGGSVQYFYKGWSFNAAGGGAPTGAAGGDLSGTYPNPSVISAPYSGLTASSNLVAKTEGVGGSLTPVGTGQIAGSQMWLPSGVPDPVPVFSLTGGSILSGHAIGIQIVFNTAAGETVASRIIVPSNVPCSSGTSCSVFTPAPMLPPGYTGYTVYSCDGNPCTPQRQSAANACVNIVTSCTTTAGSTSGINAPTIQTAFIQPPNVQASSCPPSYIPSIFIGDTSGNFQTQAGVDPFFDVSGGPPAPGGTFTFCRRVWVNDTGSAPPLGKNAMVALYHKYATGTALTNQDRAFSILGFNGTTDVATHYALEGIQSELDFQGAPAAINGSPDGEVAAASFQLADSHTNAINSPSFGVTGERITTSRSGAGTYGSCTYCLFGSHIFVNNVSATSFGGGTAVGVAIKMSDFGPATNMSAYGLLIQAPGRYPTVNRGIDIESHGTNLLDFNFFSEAASVTAGRNFFQGNVYLPNIITAGGNIGITAALTGASSYGTAQLATPSGFGNGAITVQGVTGATTDTYKITAVDGNGKESPVSSAGTTTIANATLTGSNFNRISFSAVYVIGVGSYNVYRTAAGGTPSTTGKIGSVTITSTVAPAEGFAQSAVFDDTGLAGDGSTPPTVNETGSILGYGYYTGTNCAASGTAANPSVVTCGAAPAGAVYCDVAASAGTCTINTNAVTSVSRVFITFNTADGTELGKTCNTVPSVLPVAYYASKVAGTSFTLNVPTGITNGFCFEYFIVN